MIVPHPFGTYLPTLQTTKEIIVKSPNIQKVVIAGGDMMAIVGSLIAHLAYGGVMGFVYGDGDVAV